MKDNEITTTFYQDINLKEAVCRHEQKMLSIPVGLNDLVLQRAKESASKEQLKKRKVWLYITLASAVAACILLLLAMRSTTTTDKEVINDKLITELKPIMNKTEKEQKTDIAIENNDNKNIEIAKVTNHNKLTNTKNNYPKSNEKPMPSNLMASNTTAIIKPRNIKPQIEIESDKCKTNDEIPDTLGSLIFQSPENMKIALELLSECDTTIRQEKQEVRNYLIETSFNVMSPAKNAILVTEENGDFNVVNPDIVNIIEL